MRWNRPAKEDPLVTARSIPRPGGAIAARALHFFWLADCSGSMSEDGKIQALNHAIREAIPHMRRVADDNPNARVLVRALCFSTGARWHVAQPTPVEAFEWADVQAEGFTDLGEALRMLAEVMRSLGTGERTYPPVLVLLSDGQPTDDFEGGLRELLATDLGEKAVRIAIAIGANADLERLQEFIGDRQRRPLQASNPETLVSYIKWASTAVVHSVSSPAGGPATLGRQAEGAVPIPKPPASTDELVW
jgi:uncharacterized protein YegL